MVYRSVVTFGVVKLYIYSNIRVHFRAIKNGWLELIFDSDINLVAFTECKENM